MTTRRRWEPDPDSILDSLLAAAANRGHGTRKGDKRTPAEIASVVAGKRHTVLRKQAEAMERRPKRARKMWHGASGVTRLLRALQPGAWYGVGDMLKLSGLAHYFDSIVWQRLWPAGWIERARNAAYDPALVIFSKAREPQWLWRLTATGTAERERRAIGPTPEPSH